MDSKRIRRGAAGSQYAIIVGLIVQSTGSYFLALMLFAAAGAIWLDQPLSLPSGTSELGQWLIGSALGCHFSREFFRRAPRFLALVLGATLLAMCAAALAAEALGWLGALDQRLPEEPLRLGVVGVRGDGLAQLAHRLVELAGRKIQRPQSLLDLGAGCAVGEQR